MLFYWCRYCIGIATVAHWLCIDIVLAVHWHWYWYSIVLCFAVVHCLFRRISLFIILRAVFEELQPALAFVPVLVIATCVCITLCHKTYTICKKAVEYHNVL